MPRNTAESAWFALCLVWVTSLVVGCAGFAATNSAPDTYAGPDDLLVRMAAGGVPCVAANPARRATEDGGVSVACVIKRTVLIVTTYPSAAERAESLQQAAAVIDRPVDVLVGRNWTVACEAAGNCDRLEAILGGTVALV